MTSHFLFLVLMVICLLSNPIFGYSVSGNKLLDPNGNPILIRGLDRPSLEWSSTGQDLSLSDYELMRGWNANAIRLSLNECFLLPNRSGYNPDYASIVDQQVQWIKSLGMGVILDLHWSNHGCESCSCGQQVMADNDSVIFWTLMATKYMNDPMIMFELYNEPHSVSWEIWLNGGNTGAGFVTPGMQGLYDTVRSTGADNVVVVGGLNWAYDLSGVQYYPLSGYNIIYNTHVYDYPGKQPSDWNASFGYLTPTYPVISTEFGDYNCDPTYYQEFIDYANQLFISWTSWAWFVNGCDFPSVISDWNGDAINGSGVVVQQALLNGYSLPTTSAFMSSSITFAPSSTVSSTSSTISSSTSQTSQSNSNSNRIVGIAVGLTVGLVSLTAFAGLMVFLVYRRKKKSDLKTNNFSNTIRNFHSPPSSSSSSQLFSNSVETNPKNSVSMQKIGGEVPVIKTHKVPLIKPVKPLPPPPSSASASTASSVTTSPVKLSSNGQSLPAIPIGSTGNKNSNLLSSSDFHVGTRCQALYSGDGKFYKVVIDQIKDGNYLVRYVDFGNDSEWRPLSCLRR